ncbi:hypothetical protein FEF22_000275 [Texas Phoenix palm phytoplasma]|uniref:Uncharacterized protein n=1 Tax=Texas Phoenix palm phytoplasma TaxID=176709 RepID=A0ABS5BI19_9MOLU|nr:hypothetical protein [Texas Phoenix palm phytoplasma]MBP3059225.1 hypothetical protein [Texas Phoenix palm phytoplasma]
MIFIESFLKIFNIVFSFLKEQYYILLQFRNINFSNTEKILPNLGNLLNFLFSFLKISFIMIIIYFIQDIFQLFFNFIYLILFLIKNIFKIFCFPFRWITNFLKIKFCKNIKDIKT